MPAPYAYGANKKKDADPELMQGRRFVIMDFGLEWLWGASRLTTEGCTPMPGFRLRTLGRRRLPSRRLPAAEGHPLELVGSSGP